MAFRNLIVEHANPSEWVNVSMGEADDNFRVQCPKDAHTSRKRESRYAIWDTLLEKLVVHTRTENVTVPDLKQFRTYFVSLLIHNRDGWVMDYVLRGLHDRGITNVFDIHDAYICNPADAGTIRSLYGEAVKTVYNNRNVIIPAYFKSIGMGAAGAKAWGELVKLVAEDKVESDWTPDYMILK